VRPHSISDDESCYYIMNDTTSYDTMDLWMAAGCSIVIIITS
jgi:hypothetical protein